MGILDSYEPGSFFDEAMTADGVVRPHYRELFERLDGFSAEELTRRERLKDAIFRTQGITFTVYGDEEGTERTFPLDLLPRIIPDDEWALLEAGLTQRVSALNMFLDDLYVGEQAILEDGVVPRALIESASGYLPEAIGIPAPHQARCLVSGIDLVRGDDGRYFVLEDNLRNPSGVSYVLENRSAMTRVLPVAFHRSTVRSVDHYPTLLLEALRAVAPGHAVNPRVVLLTPGRYNSAFFEHAFLARQMGIELVEAADLIVVDGSVRMRTTRGLKRVDVIYRRIDDDFLDPDVFRPDSMLGVRGIIGAARNGLVTICNAVGNGVADDKAVYAYVPAMIKYYLGSEPLLDTVPTYLLEDPDALAQVLDRLDQLVVKPVDASGGYGMLIGPVASDEEIATFRTQLAADPRAYIAQEVVSLSRHPTLVGDEMEGRHIDLRPFVVSGATTKVLPGGLTRVALRRGSLVVNSSQGGGSKDTWVLARRGTGRVNPDERAHKRAPRQSEVVPARVGADLFWAGRYLERAEATARLLDVAYHGVLEEQPDHAGGVLQDLLDALDLGFEFRQTERSQDADTVADYLVADRTNLGSARAAIGIARENVRTIQEKVSRELWEALNSLHLELNQRDLGAELRIHPFDVFARVRRGCQTVVGIIEDTMSHNDGWRFLTMGRQLERAMLTTRLLDVYVQRLLSDDHVIAFHHWVGVLQSAGALQEYRKVFQASLDPVDAVEFLLQSVDFPRSTLCSTVACEAAFEGVQGDAHGSEARRTIGLARSRLEFADIESVIADGGLSGFLAETSRSLETFSNSISDELFSVDT